MKIDFWVLLGRDPVPVSIGPEESLVDLWKKLRRDPNAAKFIPSTFKFSYLECTFYWLKNPVPMLTDDSCPADDILDQVRHACLEKSNRTKVHPVITRVRLLAGTFLHDHIYLVIGLPNALRASIEALVDLRQQHSALFQCLLVRVQHFDTWCREDVINNLKGGSLFDTVSQLPGPLKNIQEALEQKRTYNEPTGATVNHDYDNARLYNNAMFNHVFEATNGPPTVVNDREFAAFYSLLRCFGEDVGRIAADSSSSFKARNFTLHFIQPPFFSEIPYNFRSFQYKQEESWKFPLFVNETDILNTTRKFTPKTDWMVISPDYLIPFVISKVISLEGENDRFRMLLEAVTLARAGQFLMKPQSSKSFFVVAVYLNKGMIASRYILMPRNTDPENSPVDILQKDFDLKRENDHVEFLREMYNLSTQITLLSNELDRRKKHSLYIINDWASQVLPLRSEDDGNTTHEDGSTTESIKKIGGVWDDGEDEDNPRIFEAEDIQNVLHRMNYKFRHCVYGHPHLAIIENKSNRTIRYFKFIARENELEILRYLGEIKSPSNHTIHDVQFWPVEGGTVISMPAAGGLLTSLEEPDEDLWSVTLQLVEAVAFMHEHNVAHMDIKPQNVIVPVAGGRLSIIDFSVSIRVSNGDVRSSRVVGTTDYIAPEVEKGKYKPMLADLWSCGRTLEELCTKCRPSGTRSRVLEIAKSLMKDDPEGRPQMSTVLEWMSHARREDGDAMSITSS